MAMKKPFMLMILDGWGLNDNADQKNAIREVNPKNFNYYWENYPKSVLKASGEAVGLPDGQMGNSEVGHLNMGAGRVMYQPLVKITKDIKEGKILENKVMIDVMEKTKSAGKVLHLAGLLSDGGVHSHITHIAGLLEMAKKYEIEKVFVHAILDGRDVPPKSALTYIEQLENKMKEIGVGEIATVSGRYYTMDRDKNWDRIEKAYDAIVNGAGVNKNFSAKKAVEISYMEDITDEFVKPTVITDKAGNPIGSVKDGDGFIFFNFRPDRAREITRAINDKEFDYFVRETSPSVNYVCMTEYDATIDAPVAFPPESPKNTFGEVLSANGLTQYRTAETEKYAHVTFFFNGGQESEFEGEERLVIPSPKVETYDMQPEMSAGELTNSLIKRLDEAKDDVVIVNYANPDMVGHTGDFEAAKKAVEAVDGNVKMVVDKVLEKGGTVFITADHGNVDLMEDPNTKAPFTAHTTNPVPFIVVSDEFKNIELKSEGKLADIAPTILKLMKLDQPKDMTGDVLVK
jgi:2,3-bisphosphoglycerate-independent phosphoglycerate mutase